MLRHGMTVLTLALMVVAARAWAEEAKTAKKNLEGTWKVTSAEQNGETKDQFKDATVTFTDGKFTVKHPDGNTHSGTYKIVMAGGKPAIDMTADSGPNEGKTFQCIFSVDGDTLKICRPVEAGKERPTEFSAKADSGMILFTLTREKP